MKRIALKTGVDCITHEQLMQALLSGLSVHIGPDNKYIIGPPCKFNPAWFPPPTISFTRPKAGDGIVLEGRRGWIVYIDNDDVHCKFVDGEEEYFDLDNFHSHVSRGRRNIWTI